VHCIVVALDIINVSSFILQYSKCVMNWFQLLKIKGREIDIFGMKSNKNNFGLMEL
jgi:hypothetical protein